MRMSAMIHLIDPGATSHPATLETLERRQSRKLTFRQVYSGNPFSSTILTTFSTPSRKGEIGIFIIIATAEGYAWNMLHTALLSYPIVPE